MTYKNETAYGRVLNKPNSNPIPRPQTSPPSNPVVECEKQSVCHTIHRVPKDVQILQQQGHAGFHQACILDICKEPRTTLLPPGLSTIEIAHILNCSISLVEAYRQIDKKLEGFQRCFEDNSLRWQPMCKGVSDFWRFSQVPRQANERYLKSLCCANPKGKVIKKLDSLCRSHKAAGKRFSRFDPVSSFDCS